MINIPDIDHVLLRVRDLDRVVAFYIDVLGARWEKRQEPQCRSYLLSGAVLGRRHRARHFAAHGIGGEIVSRLGADGQRPSIYLEAPEGKALELKGPPWAPVPSSNT